MSVPRRRHLGAVPPAIPTAWLAAALARELAALSDRRLGEQAVLVADLPPVLEDLARERRLALLRECGRRLLRSA
jgi:hypothetical protein